MISTRKLLIANWKSNLNKEQADDWVRTFALTATSPHHDIVVCPPFTLLETVSRTQQEVQAPFSLGLQNISAFPAGSYTGEISIQNIERFPIGLVLLGHSERRRYCHETNQDVAKKAELVVQAELQPVVCIDLENVTGQLSTLPEEIAKRCIFAFEDPQHIGTGIPSDIQSVMSTVQVLRQALGPSTQMLYGGSVSETTAGEFLIHPEVAGLLVGSASLSPNSFAELANLST